MADWITIAAAAEMSGYHPEYIRELVRQEVIKGRKFATVWQVNRTALIAYIAAAKQSEDRRHGPKRS